MFSHNDEEINNLLLDPIQFKIACAEEFLKTIPTYVPLDIQYKKKAAEEMSIECFLFFAVGTLDILFQEINIKLKLELRTNEVRPSTIMMRLKNNQTIEAKEILDEFNRYFQMPEHTETTVSEKEFRMASIIYDDEVMAFFTEYENRETIKYKHSWKRENSRLWELRNQRNLITHESLLKKAGQVGSCTPKNFIRIRLTYNDQPTRTWDSAHYDNPKEYYQEAFDSVKKFVDSVRSTLKKLN